MKLSSVLAPAPSATAAPSKWPFSGVRGNPPRLPAELKPWSKNVSSGKSKTLKLDKSRDSKKIGKPVKKGSKAKAS